MKNSRWDKENSLSRRIDNHVESLKGSGSRERNNYQKHVSPGLQHHNNILSDKRHNQNLIDDHMLAQIHEASNEDLRSQS